jgi:Domain of Unknown Function (DUF1540).
MSKMDDSTKLSDKKTKKKEYIPGVECSVANCQYNDEKRNCYAQKIEVSPMNAQEDDDTKCATFRQKPSDGATLL